jgi:hypothetical protein
MSRGRPDSGEPSWGAFGEQLKNELKSALQLLLRNARLNSVALLPSEVSWTTFQANLLSSSVSIPLKATETRISPDVVSLLKKMSKVGPSPLISLEKVRLHSDKMLQSKESFPQSVALLNASEFSSNALSLPKAQFCRSSQWPVAFSTELKEAQAWPVTPCKTELRSGFKRIQGKFHQLPLMLSKRFRDSFKSGSRFKSLPIQKSSVPLHRFSTEARQIFRESLASKYKIAKENIQLVSIFDRVTIRHYAELEQAPQGQLLCTPKISNAVKKRETQTIDDSPSYLIVGLRLDTKQEIHALIPGSKLQESQPSAEQETTL